MLGEAAPAGEHGHGHRDLRECSIQGEASRVQELGFKGIGYRV